MSPKFTQSDGYVFYMDDDTLDTGTICAAQQHNAIRSILQSTLNNNCEMHLCTYWSARFYVSSWNDFRMPKYNSPRNSRYFSEQLRKFNQFCFGNLDTHCNIVVVPLVHAPFFEVHLCLSRTVKNTPRMKFLSRSLFHREHTSILILLFDSSSFPFYLVFTFVLHLQFYSLIVEIDIGSLFDVNIPCNF